jgi:hypothetical protein
MGNTQLATKESQQQNSETNSQAADVVKLKTKGDIRRENVDIYMSKLLPKELSACLNATD